MDPKEEVNYRLRLCEGFAREAEEYFQISHWRSCVSSAQLCVENASKAVLALYQPVVKIHDLSKLLMDLIEEQGTTGDLVSKIEKLADNARILGFQERPQNPRPFFTKTIETSPFFDYSVAALRSIFLFFNGQ